MCWLEIRFKLHFSVNSSDGLGIIRRQQLREGGGVGGNIENWLQRGGGKGGVIRITHPHPPPTRKIMTAPLIPLAINQRKIFSTVILN